MVEELQNPLTSSHLLTITQTFPFDLAHISTTWFFFFFSFFLPSLNLSQSWTNRWSSGAWNQNTTSGLLFMFKTNICQTVFKLVFEQYIRDVPFLYLYLPKCHAVVVVVPLSRSLLL